MKFISNATGEEYTLETALAHAALYSGPVGSQNEAHLRILAYELAAARKQLNDAATSLCTISKQAGRTEELLEWSQVRGYAFSRYSAALAAKEDKP